MGKHGKRKGDSWAHLVADVLVRVGLFVLTALFVIGAYLRYHRHYPEDEVQWVYVGGIALVAATLAAVFGPWLYHSEAGQGRGTLQQVKRDSDQPKH